MYRLRNVFQQQPAAISATLVAVINAGLVWLNIGVTVEQLALTDSALVMVLALFYVAPSVVSKHALRELQRSLEQPPPRGRVDRRADRPR